MGDVTGSLVTIIGMSFAARFIVLAVVMADQLTKAWVSDALRDGPRQLLGPFRLVLVHNSGAAFGTLGSVTPLLTVLGVAAAVYAWLRAGRRAGWESISWGLIGGGAAGNVFDRLFRDPGPGWGRVVDFIAIADFPVFNLADVAVCAGVILFALTRMMQPSESRS
jgi:signal peptidase II